MYVQHYGWHMSAESVLTVRIEVQVCFGFHSGSSGPASKGNKALYKMWLQCTAHPASVMCYRTCVVGTSDIPNAFSYQWEQMQQLTHHSIAHIHACNIKHRGNKSGSFSTARILQVSPHFHIYKVHVFGPLNDADVALGTEVFFL